MISCEFREISKNTFFTEHLRTTASVWYVSILIISWKRFVITWNVFLGKTLKQCHWCPRRHLLVQSQQWKNENIVRNLFKANKSRHLNNNVVLVSLLLALNRFQTLFSCFRCYLWTSKCRLWYPVQDFVQDLYKII